MNALTYIKTFIIRGESNSKEHLFFALHKHMANFEAFHRNFSLSTNPNIDGKCEIEEK